MMTMTNDMEKYLAKLVRDYKAACALVDFHWRNLQLNDRPADRYRALLDRAILQCKLEVMEQELTK